jgi:alkanesulfonate monooxygenase SsuD/methylene tetrahydromethanopterin reductase-like flavin-dependent oxidoreductase (luciferase family)
VEIGFCLLLPDLRTTVEVAAIAEEGGVGWLGICDSPYLYADPHAAMQAAARVTSSIRVGTFVTNPVTRHWSVQAAAFRALAEVAPGRGFMGIAPGDSAVHSVGLPPASPQALAAYAREIRRHGPAELPVMVAAGGPLSVRVAAGYADELVIGQGASEGAMAELEAIAARAHAASGAAHPLNLWACVLLNLAERTDGVEDARSDIKSAVVAYSRQALDRTFEHKCVPEELHGPLRELYTGYSFDEHSKPGRTRNARLLERADLEAFLFDRFAVVDTPEAAAERVLEIAEKTGVERVFLSAISSDPVSLMQLAAARLMPRLPTSAAATVRVSEA